MNYRVLKLVMVWFALFFSGCGLNEVNLKQNFTVEMYGSFEAPVGASGSYEPKWQNYLLNAVNLEPQDGSETVNLMTDQSTTIRIIDRPQIIFETSMSKYSDKIFSSLTVQVDPTVIVAGRLAEDYATTLDSGDIKLVEEFTVSAARSITVYVKVKWKNTIALDEASGNEIISLPSFEVELK